MLLTMRGEWRSLVGTHEAHEIESNGSSFKSQQHGATSRLGPDMVPPNRPVRSDDAMSIQGSETSCVPFPHPSASASASPDVPVASVEPEKIPQTVSTRRITFERPPNPLDRAEPPKRTTADDDEDSVIWV